MRPGGDGGLGSERPGGLDTDIAALKRLCGNDPEALDAIDKANQNPTGVYNVHTSRLSGNAEDRALRKLRKDRPDLHEQVLSHGKSAHAAMVEAGYRPSPSHDSGQCFGSGLRV